MLVIVYYTRHRQLPSYVPAFPVCMCTFRQMVFTDMGGIPGRVIRPVWASQNGLADQVQMLAN
jgi:hypothetical protein